MAGAYLRQARRILGEAERHHRDEAWHLAVRRSQEAVELALKGVLRGAGIEIPRVHDVGVFLLEHRGRLPEALTKHLDRIVSISRRLAREREISFYGDDDVGAPPDQLYTAADGTQALEDAQFVVALSDASLPPAGRKRA